MGWRVEHRSSEGTGLLRIGTILLGILTDYFLDFTALVAQTSATRSMVADARRKLPALRVSLRETRVLEFRTP
jgi:hypothetical protein